MGLIVGLIVGLIGHTTRAISLIVELWGCYMGLLWPMGLLWLGAAMGLL